MYDSKITNLEKKIAGMNKNDDASSAIQSQIQPQYQPFSEQGDFDFEDGDYLGEVEKLNLEVKQSREEEYEMLKKRKKAEQNQKKRLKKAEKNQKKKKITSWNLLQKKAKK